MLVKLTAVCAFVRPCHKQELEMQEEEEDQFAAIYQLQRSSDKHFTNLRGRYYCKLVEDSV